MEGIYIVYVKADEENRIIAVNSSAFMQDTTGWTQIDGGYGYNHHHAQGNYFPKPVYDERGVCRYKLVDGRPVERTAEEMDADYAALPAPEPTQAERIAMLEEQNAMLTECLLEMSEMIYA